MNIQLFFEYDCFTQSPKHFRHLGTILLARRATGEALTIQEAGGKFVPILHVGNNQKVLELSFSTIDECLDFLMKFVKGEALESKKVLEWLCLLSEPHRSKVFASSTAATLQERCMSLEEALELV